MSSTIALSPTAETFQFEGKSFFRTGDVGLRDCTSQVITCLGRKSREANVFGVKVQLEALERCALLLDSVSESAAIHSNSHGPAKLFAVSTKSPNEIRTHLRKHFDDALAISIRVVVTLPFSLL